MSDITQLIFCICCNKHISCKREREHRRQALKPPTNPTPCKRPQLAFKAARTPRDKAKPACKPPECQDMFSTLDLKFPVPLMSDSETNHRLESSEPGDDADLLLTTCMSRRWHQHNVDCPLLLDSDEDFDEDNGQDVEDSGNLAPDIPLEDGPNNDESEFLDCDELGQDGGLPLRDELGESFESRYTMIGVLYFVHLWSSKMLTIPAAEKLDESDRAMCRAFAFKVSTHMPDAAWKKACYAFHTTPPIPGLLQLRSRANFLAGFTAEVYDCCPNSCLCYTGPHSDATSCVYCGLSQYHGQGKPRKRFTYIPLIPRLQAFCTNAEIATRMQYRHQSESDAIPGVIRDVFEGAHYKALKSKIVQINKKTFQHRYCGDSLLNVVMSPVGHEEQ
jgi:hypothetical protein